MQTKLSAALVRRVTEQEPPARDTSYFDVIVPRLALRTKPPRHPGGRWASLFFVRYTAPNGSERRIKIGDPGTMTLEAARAAAKATLALADRGGDPASDKADARASWTVRQAAEAYLASPEFLRKTAKTQSCDRGTIVNHIVHRLGPTKLADLDVPAVRRLLRAVESDSRKNKRKRRLGGAGAARKMARVLSSLCTWAVGEGQLERNPLIGNLRLDGDGSRDTVLTEPEQYTALLAAMDRLVADGKLRALSRAFITVAAFTAMRRGELQALRWGQVDLAQRRITLVGTKGAKLARSGPKFETLSLPPLAAAALAAIRPTEAGDAEQVFVPRRGKLMEVNRDWQAVRTAAGLPTDLALHGLRHSVGTVAVMAGLSGPEVQKLLRHRNISTTAKYVHLADRTRLQDRAMAAMVPGDAAPEDLLPLRRPAARER